MIYGGYNMLAYSSFTVNSDMSWKARQLSKKPCQSYHLWKVCVLEKSYFYAEAFNNVCHSSHLSGRVHCPHHWSLQPRLMNPHRLRVVRPQNIPNLGADEGEFPLPCTHRNGLIPMNPFHWFKHKTIQCQNKTLTVKFSMHAIWSTFHKHRSIQGHNMQLSGFTRQQNIYI